MPAQRLGFYEKFSYALGDTATNLYFQFFSIFIVYYYTDVYGLDPAVVTTMLTVKLWDWITDPVMGIIAGRTSTRWSKFRPYPLWMSLPYGLLGYLMFINPDLDESGKLTFAYVTYILMMTAYTAINVPYGALMGVMTSCSSERRHWYGRCTVMSLIMASGSSDVVPPRWFSQQHSSHRSSG